MASCFGHRISTITSPETRAKRAIEYVTDDRDPTIRDLLVLMAIEHNAHEGWLDADELNGIIADIVRETEARLDG